VATEYKEMSSIQRILLLVLNRIFPTHYLL